MPMIPPPQSYPVLQADTQRIDRLVDQLAERSTEGDATDAASYKSLDLAKSNEPRKTKGLFKKAAGTAKKKATRLVKKLWNKPADAKPATITIESLASALIAPEPAATENSKPLQDAAPETQPAVTARQSKPRMAPVAKGQPWQIEDLDLEWATRPLPRSEALPASNDTPVKPVESAAEPEAVGHAQAKAELTGTEFQTFFTSINRALTMLRLTHDAVFLMELGQPLKGYSETLEQLEEKYDAILEKAFSADYITARMNGHPAADALKIAGAMAGKHAIDELLASKDAADKDYARAMQQFKQNAVDVTSPSTGNTWTNVTYERDTSVVLKQWLEHLDSVTAQGRQQKADALAANGPAMTSQQWLEFLDSVTAQAPGQKAAALTAAVPQPSRPSEQAEAEIPAAAVSPEAPAVEIPAPAVRKIPSVALSNLTGLAPALIGPKLQRVTKIVSNPKPSIEIPTINTNAPHVLKALPSRQTAKENAPAQSDAQEVDAPASKAAAFEQVTVMEAVPAGAPIKLRNPERSLRSHLTSSQRSSLRKSVADALGIKLTSRKSPK